MGQVRDVHRAVVWALAQQHLDDLPARIEIRAIDLLLVVEASLADDSRVDLVEPVGRGHDHQPGNVTIEVDLLEQGVHELLLVV